MTIKPKTIHPDIKYFGSFTQAFRKHVHTLLYWGYNGALSRITNDSHDETVLTGFICEGLKNKLRSFIVPDWCRYYAVFENRPEEKDGIAGKKRSLPDIVIEGTMQGRPEFIFESKRLKGKDFGVAKYTGKDGMGCFIEGKYASRYDEAGMIGYVQGDSLPYWKSAIREKINKDSTDLKFISLQEKLGIIDELPDEWLSVHNRPDMNRPISIYHILFDFRSEIV